MKRRIMMAVLTTLVVANAACTACGPSTSVATTQSATTTLAVSSGVTTYRLEVNASEQDCGPGCNLCTEPLVTMTLSGHMSWESPSDASAAPVVRLTLTPIGSFTDADIVEPPSPVDVAILPETPNTGAFTVTVTHACKTDEGCILDYLLSAGRVETDGSGSVDVVLNADATYSTKAKAGVTVSIHQESATP